MDDQEILDQFHTPDECINRTRKVLIDFLDSLTTEKDNLSVPLFIGCLQGHIEQLRYGIDKHHKEAVDMAVDQCSKSYIARNLLEEILNGDLNQGSPDPTNN